ncbi:MAG: Stk1 family PASTA domain-containing Ser/Thr kinase, partial [Eggerthellaceae bacterium]|nr:Stk1 family PASTA domain-containing Ser/Thr kinase [Eggerthellaceae bacterium]
MIGRVFNDRYRITEKIGIGGMAEVYKAQDQVLGRTVAIKVMLPQYAQDEEFTQRFRHEAAAAANLQNPYIVNVYDWGNDSGTYYIVMEYVRGIDLKSAIKQRGAINQRKVAEIGSQVCQALKVAHDQDIVHRDIKPQNIMVQPDGNVKVMDFGIARAKNSVRAQTSSVLGTAHYISPEQAQGKELTGASDIYSLGCVLYEAATGSLPFEGEEAVNVALKQVQEAPVAPSAVNSSISPVLEGIILRAMEKNPQNRYQTARDMRTALDDFLMGRTTEPDARPTQHNMAQAHTAVVPAQSTAHRYAQSGDTMAMPAIDASYNESGPINFSAKDVSLKKNSVGKKVGLGIGIILAIAAAAVVAYLAVTNLSLGIEVPDVVGMTQGEAESAIKEAGFEVGTITEEYDANVLAGNVASQDPKAHSKMPADTRVNLVISKGIEQSQVPNLSGRTADEAQKALAEAGFVAKFAGNEESDSVAKDLIARQSPNPGDTLEKGSEVSFWVSTGSSKISVPNVLGMDENTAVSTLQAAGLKANVIEGTTSSTYSKGTVMAQDPATGQVESGTTITLSISKGNDNS